MSRYVAWTTDRESGSSDENLLLLDHVRHVSRELMATGDSNLVRSMMNWTNMCMADALKDEQEPEKNKTVRSWLIYAIQWACIWSVGATSDNDSRTKFDAFFRDLLRGKFEPIPDIFQGKFDIQIPDKGLVHDYYFGYKNRGDWFPWENLMRAAEGAAGAMATMKNIRRYIVPTVDTTRVNFMLDLVVPSKKPILFVGPTGTGKSVYVQNYLMNKIDKDQYMAFFINFSAQTSNNQVQVNIEEPLPCETSIDHSGFSRISSCLVSIVVARAPLVHRWWKKLSSSSTIWTCHRRINMVHKAQLNCFVSSWTMAIGTIVKTRLASISKIFNSSRLWDHRVAEEMSWRPASRAISLQLPSIHSPMKHWPRSSQHCSPSTLKYVSSTMKSSSSLQHSDHLGTRVHLGLFNHRQSNRSIDIAGLQCCRYFSSTNTSQVSL